MVRHPSRAQSLSAAAVCLAMLLASCGDETAPPDGPDNSRTCRLPPDDYAAITTFNSVAAGNAGEEGELSYQILAAKPGALVVRAAATSLEGHETPSQRASVLFDDYIDILPADESLVFEPIILRYQIDYRLEVEGPEAIGAVARIEFPEFTTSIGPIADSTKPNGSSIISGTQVIDYQMHTQAPDVPPEHMQFVAYASAFSFNEGQEVSAKADISFDLIGVFDQDGEPFSQYTFCTASGWNWTDT